VTIDNAVQQLQLNLLLRRYVGRVSERSCLRQLLKNPLPMTGSGCTVQTDNFTAMLQPLSVATRLKLT